MQVFFCDFCKMFKNSFVTEHLPTTASIISFASLLPEYGYQQFLRLTLIFSIQRLTKTLVEDSSVFFAFSVSGFRHLGFIGFHLK